MIKLHIVGDGPRDARTLPPLIAGILGIGVEAENFAWQSIRVRGGYPGKVRFAVRRAMDAKAEGVVAVIDADNDPSRIKKLREGRELDRRSHPPYPTALGQADPHGEVWLLDDPVAVRTALRLASDWAIINVRRASDPKAELHALIRQSERAADDHLIILAEIAQALDCSRCNHARETGLHDFKEDVKTELGPVAAPHRQRG